MSDTASNNTPVTYPGNTFESALEVGRVVADAGGANAAVQKASIAGALNSSDRSGAFLTRIASARTYGIIVSSRNGYRLTDEAKKYFHPSDDAEKQRALLMMLKSAQIFADIIKRFDGTKINSDMFSNVLLREFKIPADSSGRIARYFLAAAKFAGALDDQGYLRYVATRQSISQMTAPSSPSANAEDMSASSRDDSSGDATRLDAKLSHITDHESVSGDGDGGVWRLGGTTVRIETSGKLSEPLWNLLNGYVQALKPSKEAKK